VSEQDRGLHRQLPLLHGSLFLQRVFSFQAAYGTIPENGLQPGEIILSETYARKFFGARDATGQTLLIGKESTPGKRSSPSLKDNFQKSHLDPQIVSAADPGQDRPGAVNWSSAALYNYVKLKRQRIGSRPCTAG